MTFAKANNLLTTKRTSKSTTNQNITDFMADVSQGSVLKNEVTPVARESAAKGSGQEVFVNNGSFGQDPLRNALGSSWALSGDSIATANSDENLPLRFPSLRRFPQTCPTHRSAALTLADL